MENILLIFLGVNAVGIVIFSYATNPFNRRNVVKDPHGVSTSGDGSITLIPLHELSVRSRYFFHILAGLKSGYHIMTNTLSAPKKTTGNRLDDVIREIHNLRFHKKNPFLISGDHFSVLYPRSLGIFYHTLLDSRTALDSKDWHERQSIYLKTISYALMTFAKSKSLATTIVPIGRLTVTTVNIYSYPSDTLYSLLYALKVLIDDKEIDRLYPFQAVSRLNNSTMSAGIALYEQYRNTLARHYKTYRSTVFDPTTNLIKTSIKLSGTKDMAKRQSAFYDNVIFWRTTQLAQELGIIERDPAFLDSMKKIILKTYWDSKQSFFHEDINKNRYSYSSDWLIAYQTGFLSPENNYDRLYLQKILSYIHENKIDQPFGLKYHPDNRREQLYWPVRLFAPDYGSKIIWSHWGMEYIKLLAHLGSVTNNQTLIERAREQLNSYKLAITKYHAYPEVYSPDGKPFRQGMYRSVLRTGWIVNFEQAEAMLKSISGKQT